MNNSEKYLELISIEEAGFAFTMRNADIILKNSFSNARVTGEFEKIHPNLLKIVSRCKTIEDVKYLQHDKSISLHTLNALKENLEEIEKHPNNVPSKLKKLKDNVDRHPKLTSKNVQKHIDWINGEYTEALNKKKKEIANK